MNCGIFSSDGGKMGENNTTQPDKNGPNGQFKPIQIFGPSESVIDAINNVTDIDANSQAQ